MNSNKVILISVDGMRPDGFLACGNPYIENMMASAYYTLDGKTVLPSVTLPCHMSLFHSVTPQRHGITTNLYLPMARPINGLFEQLKNAGKFCAMYYGWEPLRDVARPASLKFAEYINAYTEESSDTALTDSALSLVCVRFCSKDKYEQNIYTYGLCFSNFGFMGNAVVSALFPEIFLEYLIFTLPLWILIYLWGVPVLLMGSTEKQTLRQRAKSFVNPMLVCMLLGMLIGLINIPIPKFVSSAVSAAGSCMSPVAMLLTGMTIAKFNLREVLSIKGVYLVTALRLIVFPLLFLGAMFVIPMPKTFATCAICALAMPLGLNTIIIPSALGKDTKVASGMALVSHILSCLTIPVVFMLFNSLL